jgi:hypothetical protein
MKEIKKVKLNRKWKHGLLCAATFIPLVIFGVGHWFLYRGELIHVLNKIYSTIGVLTIVAVLYLLSVFLCKQIDKWYIGKGGKDDGEIYDR